MVIPGRATEANEVDIDLGEEGRANKISRRQVGFVLISRYSSCMFACANKFWEDVFRFHVAC